MGAPTRPGGVVRLPREHNRRNEELDAITQLGGGLHPLGGAGGFLPGGTLLSKARGTAQFKQWRERGRVDLEKDGRPLPIRVRKYELELQAGGQEGREGQGATLGAQNGGTQAEVQRGTAPSHTGSRTRPYERQPTSIHSTTGDSLRKNAGRQGRRRSHAKNSRGNGRRAGWPCKTGRGW